MRIRCFSTLVYGMHCFACCQCAHYANTAELHPEPLLLSYSLRILSSLAVLPSVIGSYGHLENCLVKKSMMWLCDPLIWWHFHTFFEEEFDKADLEFANGLDVEGVWAVLNLNANELNWGAHEKIAVLTANTELLKPMATLIHDECGVDFSDNRFLFVARHKM